MNLVRLRGCATLESLDCNPPTPVPLLLPVDRAEFFPKNSQHTVHKRCRRRLTGPNARLLFVPHLSSVTCAPPPQPTHIHEDRVIGPTKLHTRHLPGLPVSSHPGEAQQFAVTSPNEITSAARLATHTLPVDGFKMAPQGRCRRPTTSQTKHFSRDLTLQTTPAPPDNPPRH